jgi:diadenosine tetraphosphate (Ap4A) HIT family hydrolase
MSDDTKKFVELDNSRTDDQRSVMEQIVEAKHCPFCPEHLRKYHREPIIKHGIGWTLTHSQWPYPRTQKHLLLIANRHIERFEELTLGEKVEYWNMLDFAVREFDIEGGLQGMRFGDPAFSGATVRHLHGQLIIPATDEHGVPLSVALWAGRRRE